MANAIVLSGDVDQSADKPIAWLVFRGGEIELCYNRYEAEDYAGDEMMENGTESHRIYPLYAGKGIDIEIQG